ncbi:MAG: hypothetical protein WCP08_13510 [Prolixibacteraceae bacterium]
MSIFFRLKYATGLIPSADQLDVKWGKLIKMRDELIRMEKSDELKQYEDLKTLIDSTAFQVRKREIESLQYVGSEEERTISVYETLVKTPAIKNYKKVTVSAKLERFVKIVSSNELKRFLHLEKEVGCDDFKIRKAAHKRKEFMKTPEYVIFKEYNILRKSSDIRFWQKFINSSSYQSYLNTEGSVELMKLDELSGIISAADFKERVAYLKDKKRLVKSEEYQKILKLNELDKSSFMAEYRKLKKSKELDFFEKWDVLLDENFQGKELNTKQWQPENWLNFRMSGVSFSQNGEMQAFNGLKNVQMNNNTLALLAKKEKAQGMAWIPSVGLSPKSFEYTSSMINNAQFFRMKEGVIEAKLRFKKDASITSAFSLTGEKPFPQIDLVRSTRHGVGMGIVENQGSTASKYVKLNGLNDENYHIYRLEIANNLLIWKINGYEVYRSAFTLNEPIFFNLLTTLHGKVNEHLLPHRFEVNWIRCFSFKS